MAKVGIIMGSKSDYPVMKEAEDILKEFKVCLLYTSPSPRDS